MRQVLSISLPGTTIQTVKEKTKARGFDSVSDYIKHLIKLDEEDDWISEEEILQAAKEAVAEYKQSKLIEADSMADLYYDNY